MLNQKKKNDPNILQFLKDKTDQIQFIGWLKTTPIYQMDKLVK